MKLKPLVTAVIVTAAFTSQVFASDVTVYGKINLSYNQIEKDDAGIISQDNWELESFASRIGVKGHEAINEELKVIYKLEYQIVPDGDGSTFKSRNSYAGVQGNFGTIIAGIHDTPLKISQGKVDVFNDYSLADIAHSIPGERRENDIIIYTAPKMGNVSFSIGIMPGDDSGTGGNDKENNFADQVSAALIYKKDKLYAALAIDENVNGLNIIRVSSTYKLGDITLGALYQTAEDSDTDLGKDFSDNVKGAIDSALGDLGFAAEEHDSFVVSAQWKTNQWTLKAQIIDSSYEGGNDKLKNSAITIGADYKLSKRTKLFSHITRLTVDSNSSLSLAEDYKYTGIGLMGIEHKF